MTYQLSKEAYAYNQYLVNDFIRTATEVLNDEYQAYVDDFNSLDMPNYLSKEGLWLDWIAKGIWGQARPTIALGEIIPAIGGSANTPLCSMPASGFISAILPETETVNDDIFKRFLTWHLFVGDSSRFNVAWLKRRIKRFVMPDMYAHIDNTYDISISQKGVITPAIGGGANTPPCSMAACSFINAVIPSYVGKANMITINTQNDTAKEYNAIRFKWLVHSGLITLPLSSDSYTVEIINE